MPKSEAAKDLKREAFAHHLVKNGFNAVKAVRETQPYLSPNSIGKTAHRLSHDAKTRERILQLVRKKGVSEEKAALGIASLLDQQIDNTLDNETLSVKAAALHKGITHARAVLGMDAPKEQHIQVDKREVKLTLEASLDGLSSLMRKAGRLDKAKGVPLDSNPPLVGVIEEESVLSGELEDREESVVSTTQQTRCIPSVYNHTP